MGHIVGMPGSRAGGGAIALPWDDYGRADSAVSLGTTPSGHTWDPGATEFWGINGNQAYLPGVTSLEPARVESGVSDCLVGVTISHSGSTPTRHGLLFRYSDNDNYFYFYFISSNSLRCYKRVAGGSPTQLYARTVNYVSGDRLEAALLGDQIELYKNGIQEGAAITESHNQTATKHGLFWQTGGANRINARWDDFSVTV